MTRDWSRKKALFVPADFVFDFKYGSEETPGKPNKDFSSLG